MVYAGVGFAFALGIGWGVVVATNDADLGTVATLAVLAVLALVRPRGGRAPTAGAVG